MTSAESKEFMYLNHSFWWHAILIFRFWFLL